MIDIDMVVGAPMAATLGFAYGMGPCLISCLPFLGPVFLASDGGIKKSWKIILPLSLGRLTAYSAFGATVGMAGHYVKDTITTDSVRIVVGCAVLMMGLALLLRRTDKSCISIASKNSSPNSKHEASPPPCRGRVREGVEPLVFHDSTPIPAFPLQGGRSEAGALNAGLASAPSTLLPGGLFLMGIGMTLSPCAPLGIVLFSASMTGSAAGGLLLGLSFGLGAIVIPAIAYGIGMAYLGTRLREQLQNWRPKIERVSALLLVTVGISNLARW